MEGIRVEGRPQYWLCVRTQRLRTLPGKTFAYHSSYPFSRKVVTKGAGVTSDELDVVSVHKALDHAFWRSFILFQDHVVALQ